VSDRKQAEGSVAALMLREMAMAEHHLILPGRIGGNGPLPESARPRR
jgi:hypothetical protein